LAGLQGQYLFLSVFKWEKRKGWDILLRAYFEAGMAKPGGLSPVLRIIMK
jgi:hypothetical protein